MAWAPGRTADSFCPFVLAPGMGSFLPIGTPVLVMLIIGL